MRSNLQTIKCPIFFFFTSLHHCIISNNLVLVMHFPWTHFLPGCETEVCVYWGVAYLLLRRSGITLGPRARRLRHWKGKRSEWAARAIRGNRDAASASVWLKAKISEVRTPAGRSRWLGAYRRRHGVHLFLQLRSCCCFPARGQLSKAPKE